MFVRHGEIVGVGPSGNLLPRAIGTAGAVRAVAVSFLKESLILALQFVVEDDPPDVRITRGQALRLTQVRPIEIGVVASSRSLPVPDRRPGAAPVHANGGAPTVCGPAR